jgi:hypothetical protein
MEQRACEKKFRNMLTFYRKITVACGSADAKPKFSVVTYQEQHRAEQEVSFAGEGEMMWQEQAIEYWTTTAGGALSRDEGKTRWDQRAANYQEQGIIHDMLSPNVKFPLRLRVSTKDTVHYVNRIVDTKMYTKGETAIKKPKTEDFDKLNSRVMVGFDQHGNASADAARNDLAQKMVGAGSGQAFSDIGVLLPDITVLSSGDGVADSGEQGPGPGAPGPGVVVAAELASGSEHGELESTTATKKGVNKRKWVDIDKEAHTYTYIHILIYIAKNKQLPDYRIFLCILGLQILAII